MITLTVDKLEPNMKVAEPIVTKRGQTIVKAGETLTAQLIAKLSFYKIDSATVEGEEDEPEPEPIPEPSSNDSFISDQITYSQRLKASPKFQKFQSDYALNISYLKENFEAIIAGGGSECSDLMLENCEMLFKSKTTIELLDMLRNMRNLEDPLYSHSLNVALIARSIGKWLQLPKEELDVLTLSGLLHDIGKTQIPESILNKPGKYTDEEFELMKSHPLAGKRILSDKGFDVRIPFAALQHHERSDGSGYPRGLEEDEIEDFASIIAIADVYDAMTSARAHRDPLCSFQVISEFERNLQKYNTKYILIFLERIANTYSNSRIMLSNAKTGRVVYLNKSNLSRPMVALDSGEIIDLTAPANSEVYIKSIL
ncbi:HDIG domain-containing protein [Pseudobutyrivibrio sp. YE44]|uniref:HD-GYP domain-containing protein n=1 Tax=Pseudobutyrivibrio sp. YE44 TaxID=1520802 RepID=UPI000881C9A5|nr:HD-GYP domain-containing protein [Pseudobutyrivibrio sp. YE44]SDB29622.1 HDIG domain-containing protein [Pseudobutyrivibrio sp. YE44]